MNRRHKPTPFVRSRGGDIMENPDKPDFDIHNFEKAVGIGKTIIDMIMKIIKSFG